MKKANPENNLMTLNGNKADPVEVKKEKSTSVNEYQERHQKDKYIFDEAMAAVKDLNASILKHLKDSHENIC